jgi:magnesium-transporting ATPase (P-type)
MQTHWCDSDVLSVLYEVESKESGLGVEEAKQRLEVYGENVLPHKKPEGMAKGFLRQFQSPLIYVLLVASIIVAMLGEMVDAGIILFVLLANAVIGVVQEGKARDILRALQDFSETMAVVLRDGKEIIVPDSSLVPGDVVVFRSGDKISADARLLSSNEVRIDESALTGESKPISKDHATRFSKETLLAEQKNMVFRGTFVVAGKGRAVVVATGLKTALGKISHTLESIQSELPLKAAIRSLSRVITFVILVLVSLLFVVGLLYGNSVADMFFTSVAVAVSIIPEGLPVVITLVLATGVYRMGKHNALVKNLQAVEALGRADIIAVDKTGTITLNELMVEEVYVAGEVYSVSGQGYESEGDVVQKGEVSAGVSDNLALIAKVASLSAAAEVSFNPEEEKWRIIGDPTEAALLVFGRKVGFDQDTLLVDYPKLQDIPFNFTSKYHTTLHGGSDGNLLSAVGAPEKLLLESTHMFDGSRRYKMNDERQEKLRKILQEMSRQGQRVVAVAIATDAPKLLEKGNLPDLTFLGFVGMRDGLREGVVESVHRAKQNGIRIVMITGDHAGTAEAIAREAGIFSVGDKVLTGYELESMPDGDILKVLPSVRVFARVTPEHKLKIIRLYKKQKNIIAMTGDGVNDALSLVAADLGIAMGRSGTEVTKEAADIILLDDNFESILEAVEEGRSIYATIRKVVLYLFSTGLGEVLVIVFALLLFLPLPILPSQVLWLNLVSDGFLVAAMAMDPRASLHSLRRPSKKKLVDGALLRRMLYMALVMSLGSLIVFMFYRGESVVKAQTMTLTVLAVYQWFNVWNCRSTKKSMFNKKDLKSNVYLLWAMGLVVILHILALYTPFMQKVLHTTGLSIWEWVIVLVVGGTIILFEEMRKKFVREVGV